MSGGCKKIRGMAWDHPRAVDPLRIISTQWARENDVEVAWDARRLKDFEDQPLEELASAYDLILIDHPFVGAAASSSLISPVGDWVDKSYLRDQEVNSVGPSYDSYRWNDRQWALAIDAATQVSARRDDLWRQIANDAPPPRSWDDVAEAARNLAGAPEKIAVALNPNHSYCAFLAIGVGAAGQDFWPRAQSFAEDTALYALNFLKSLSQDLHPSSRDSDPIALSELMSETDEIAYTALMYGYSSYARDGFRKRPIVFDDAPVGESGVAGSVLGGVGIALSAISNVANEAASLAQLLVSPAIQQSIYVEAGGQPGHGAAWASDAANALTRDFFRSTRESIDTAFLRPRTSGHRRFQELAGERIHSFLWKDALDAKACFNDLQTLVERHLSGWEADQEGSRRG